MQSSDHQDASGNILSPEAKEFVPRQPSHVSDRSGHRLVSGQEGLQYAVYDGFPYAIDDSKVRGVRPSGGLPTYVTTCYPFVPSAENRFGGQGPRGRGKFNNSPQMFLPPQFSHPGFPRSRFPNPAKGFVPAWNHQQLTDLYQPLSNLPNGMPFDGGTYQNGFIRTNLPQVPARDSKSGITPQHTVPSTYMTSSGDAPLLNGYKEDANQWKTPNRELPVKNEKLSTGKSTTIHQLDGISVKARKNMHVQTDFPDSIANATLEDIPNSLYKRTRKFSSSKSRHKTRRRSRDLQNVQSDSDDNDFEHGHSNMYHRKNQVSNGTNPSAIGVTIGNDLAVIHGNQNVFSYKEIVTGNRKMDKTKELTGTTSSVPYSPATCSVMFSYASVAQGLSSHNKSGPVSMATKSDKDTCDSSGKNVKGNAKGGLENVNVAQIMEDLEKAGSLKEQSWLPSNLSAETMAISKICNQTGDAPVYSWSNSAITENQNSSEINLGAMSYSEKQQKLVTESSINQASKSKGQGHIVGFQSNQSRSLEIQGQESIDSKMDVITGALTSEILTDGQEQPETGADKLEEGDGKKKRKRRRRRKKKTGESGVASDDVNSGANDEITLHFEDEEEFPDLGGVVGDNSKESSPHPVPFSYSDILKTGQASSPRQLGPVQEAIAAPDDQSSENTGAPGKETRNSRKRRKRREVANKAADAEMAEINLEQHMLELKMKQKHPLAAKKSASPVRKPASPVRTSPVQQSIWKHPSTNTSNQPSSSGKKVSLLLPGTVAPDNAPAARQPNPSAKQYSGILKTTQSAQPAQSSSQSAPSGGGTLGMVGGGGKKSKQPITYDLGALIDALEEKKKDPPPKKEPRPIINKKEEVRSANMLDSSAPIKRGKEREIPKIKKPSPLKKVILKEREEKKRLRMLDEDENTTGLDIIPITTFPNTPISAPVGIGVVSGESDLSQDASSSKGSMEVGLGTPASAELSPISQPSPSCISPMSPGASPVSSGVNSPQTGSTQQIVKLKIHSRRFREYCNQVLDKEIDSYVTALLSDLVRFQDKQYHKDPIKAKAKRRFVLGLREVTKHLKLGKIKCVIISPNLEKIQSKGGLDDALNNILDLCNEQGVPFVFALGRRALGRACAKLVPVSVVGIFNYEGSEDNFRSLVSLTEKARDSYKEMISQIEKEIAEQPPRAHVPGVPHIFAHMGHSRTPSGCSVISFTSSILSEPISENYPHSEPETDNRGYEIEKGKSDDANVDDDDDDDDDKEIAQNSDKGSFGKDPYEADDESGGTKKSSNRTSGHNENISQHINSSSNQSLLSSPVDQTSNMQSDTENVCFVNERDNHVNEIVAENSSDESDVEMSEHVSDVEIVEQNCENGEEDEEEFSDDISDNDQSREDCDTIQDLPYIDSVHHFDLHEILSTHSSKTLENGEDVLSTHSSKTTHSSRTPGEGGTTSGEKNCKIKIDIKHGETTSTLSLKGKNCLDKENRTLSWVKEAQTLHFNDEIEKTGETEENQIETNNVSLECLDAVA